MARMERYNDNQDNGNNEKSNNVLSREIRNQELYDNAYLNSSLVDISNILAVDEEEDIITKQESTEEVIQYEEKSYDVNDYLKKAHEKHTSDDAMRDLENQEFQSQEDEIRKLISAIEEKENDEDIFSDLRGDNEDTLIGGKLKTDDFDTDIYNVLKEDEERLRKYGNTLLDHAIGDTTILDAKLREEEKIDHTFDEIEDQSENKKVKKKKKLPLIIFVTSLIILIIVIVLIILNKTIEL